MRPNRQRFFNQRAARAACLGCVARIDSDHLTASTRSLVRQDVQKRAPRSVQNALCQSTTRQRADVQIFNNDQPVGIRIPLRGLEMQVAALALNLQVGLRH